ncbi:MAG: hypothetical protein AAF551_03175, partial [Bacteroidota bacterium]
FLLTLCSSFIINDMQKITLTTKTFFERGSIHVSIMSFDVTGKIQGANRSMSSLVKNSGVVIACKKFINPNAPFGNHVLRLMDIRSI